MTIEKRFTTQLQAEVGLVEGQEELNKPKMVLVMLTAIPEDRTYFICYFG